MPPLCEHCSINTQCAVEKYISFTFKAIPLLQLLSCQQLVKSGIMCMCKTTFNIFTVSIIFEEYRSHMAANRFRKFVFAPC